MKKSKVFIIIVFFTIIIIGIIVATLLICNEKKESKIIQLNKENFEDYIILDVGIEDFNVEKERGLYSLNRGVARLKATARLKKDVQVDNIVIKGRIETSGLCWALQSYVFNLELDKNGTAEYDKQITTGEAGLLYPEEPKISTTHEPKENEFIVKNSYIEVSGYIIEEIK